MSAVIETPSGVTLRSVTMDDFAELTGTNRLVVEAFFHTHAKGYVFEFGPDNLSLNAWGALGLSGGCMLPVPPSSLRFADMEARRENWWFLLGFVIGLRQGGVW